MTRVHENGFPHPSRGAATAPRVHRREKGGRPPARDAAATSAQSSPRQPCRGSTARGMVIACSAAALAMFAEAADGATIPPGPGLLKAEYNIVFPTFNRNFNDTREVPVNALDVDPATSAKFLVRAGFGTGFPQSSTTQTEQFVSTEVRADGSYDLGASMFSFTPVLKEARTEFLRLFQNGGPTTTDQVFGFTIPVLQTSIYGLPGFSDGLSASAAARAEWNYYDGAGNTIGSGDIFNHSVQIEQMPLGQDPRVTYSPDLEQWFGPQFFPRRGSGQDGSYAFETAFVLEHNVSFSVRDIAPGHTFELILQGNALADIVVEEVGAEALVGDPFNLRGPSPDAPVFSLSLDLGALGPVPDPGPDPVPSVVPLPGAAWLLLTGLGLLGVARGGQRGRKVGAKECANH